MANQGLNPLGQVETGVMVPLIGAREATFFGRSIVWLIAMLITWRVREIRTFRLTEKPPAGKGEASESNQRAKTKTGLGVDA